MPDAIQITFNTAAFTADIRRYLEATKGEMDQAVQEATYRVRSRLLAYTAVDTGRLRGAWAGPTRRKPAEWAITNATPYGPVLEEGRYRGVGPRTVRLGGRDLGHGFVVGPGIFSLQSPHGIVKRALAEEYDALQRSLEQAITRHW